ncbi:Nicotinamide adenine dinucleotide transporter 2-mitochondrial [Striga hermonthica]|uniref:Nicotinamide adenine dinucleotide transporter 2-mitochondrial n=1 Tax=Striga hermonthica TaxID=68872 RepID=A0A9N7MKE4_STRHE|nr:Nicotinamide adenine dinucleotide transporter 2-mitochondrial [Striga hermonthica]
MSAASSSGDRRSLKEIIFDASAGASAGAIAATFVCPLDVIKMRLQVHGLPDIHISSSRGSVILVSLQSIVRNEGLRGLYRGLTPTLAALLPNWAVYFTVYGHLKELLHSYEGREDQLSIASNMIAAAGAGAATSITTNPLWVVKTRLQTQGMRQGVVPYKNIFSALRRIAHEEGFRGWYSGLLPSLAGISHVAIQFPAYERIKFYLAKRENKRCDQLNSWEVAIASSFPKVVASVLTYPHEVVRSRLQEQGQVRNTELQYAAVITFTSYEMIHRFLLRVSPPDDKDSKPDHKSGGRVESQKGNERPREDNKLLKLVFSTNDRTCHSDFGNSDKITARH